MIANRAEAVTPAMRAHTQGAAAAAIYTAETQPVPALQHALHVTQHLRHLEVGASQIGDLEQRLLQPFSFFQRLDLPGLATALQRQLHGLPGQPPPRR